MILDKARMKITSIIIVKVIYLLCYKLFDLPIKATTLLNIIHYGWTLAVHMTGLMTNIALY